MKWIDGKYPGWLFFAFWMAAIVFGIGWKEFVLHFGIRAVLVVSVPGIVWVVNLWKSASQRKVE